VPRALTYAGIFLVAMATLMLEVLLTRITSVSAWYHLAFFVISIGMLGMTAGAVLVFVAPGAFPADRIRQRLAQSAVAFAAITPLCVGYTLAIPLAPVTDLMTFLALLGTAGVLSLPFVLSGITLTLALTRAGLPPSTAYAADLIGAALGCMAMIPVLDAIDAPSAALLASTVAGLSALAFARAAGRRGIGATIVVITLALCTWLNASARPSPLRPTWVKGGREFIEGFEYLDWNTYSRVTVNKSVFQGPTFWAKGRNTPAELLTPLEQRVLLIDGAAGTVIARLGEGPKTHPYLAWDITAFAHHLRPTGPAAVIGVGGGRDVLEAVRAGHSSVRGIEINDLIVGLHRDVMRDFSGIATLPGVELVADEARSYLARDTRRYDVLTMSLIDTWASTGAGAFSLSENGLYTREAWRIFLQRLTKNGIFTVSRWYLVSSPGETARMVALAMDTLWSIGSKAPLRHLVLLQNETIATLLIARVPFSEADIDRVQAEAIRMGFNMMLTPRKVPAHPLLRDLVTQRTREDMWRWTRAQELDLTPPTDARPFFFSMLRPHHWLVNKQRVDQLDLSFLGNLQATQTLVYATLVSLILTLAIIVAPMWARRREFPALRTREVVASSAYFALIGLGFMFVQMGLLSRLNVFLGRPTLALAVLLGGMIFFTGIGALLSERIDVHAGTLTWRYPLIPATLVAAVAVALPFAMDTFQARGTGVRVALSLALLAPITTGLGFGFPLGLRLVQRMEVRRLGELPEHAQGAALGPWLWGINGACGVCASGLALGTSMIFGTHVTLGVGVACYALLTLTARHLHRAGS
jgi:hypothetical protein